jgi:Kinesin motor domain
MVVLLLGEVTKRRCTMTSVRVGVRIRPLTSKEESEGGKQVVEALHPTVGIGKRKFTYDAVFDSKVSQQTLYHQVAPPLLKSFLEGYNATVSYGIVFCVHISLFFHVC